jgi:hypothetical protein
MGYLTNLAYDIFAVTLPVLAVALAELLRRKLGIEKLERIQKELETKQELAFIAVQFIEQVSIDLKGYEKYIEASYWLEGMLAERGIKTSDEEIRGLIESSLRTFKDTFGEEWAS